MAAQTLDFRHIDAGPFGVHLEVAAFEVIASLGGEIAGRCADRDRSQLDQVVGHRSLGAEARHRLAVDAAAVHLDPS